MRQLLLMLAFLLPVCVNAQFQESFSGPEITSQNQWSGDLNLFSIQDGWLVSQADVNRQSASLFLPLSYAPTMQWDFELAMNFKPSDRNHIRLHVYSDRMETSDAIVDYSLQIGTNRYSVIFRKSIRNSNKSVQLFTKALDYLKAPATLRFKLTLENRTTWSLYLYDQGKYELLSYCDSPVSSSAVGGNLGLECRYTKTRVNGFSFNYIHVSHGLSIEPEEPEEEPTLPQLMEIEALNRSAFQLAYDQPVDISEAVFSISEIGEANYQNYVDTKHQKVEIRFPKELILGVEYDFVCKGIKDVRGNKIADISNRISLTYDDGTEIPEDQNPETPSHSSFPVGSIRINEVMADPPKDNEKLSETEYVELYNTTDQAIDLSNWLFYYGDKSTALPPFVLETNQYAVLYHGDRELHMDHAALAVPLSEFPYRLANTGKLLRLVDPSGKEIDQITYEKAQYGVSWERGENGFYLSTNVYGGTPGAKNSNPEIEGEQPEEPKNPEQPTIPQAMTVFPQEIVFNELLPDPMLGGAEYIELFNRSERAISLTGLAIASRKSDGTLSTHYTLSSIIQPVQPGSFVLLTKDKNGVEPFYRIEDEAALYALKIPILANTGSTLVLFNQADESIVDEVNYSDDWHSPAVKNRKGISLERIDPDAETQDEQNWTSASSIDGGGTPGYQNSQFGIHAEDDMTGIDSPEYSEVDREYTIHYFLDQPGYVCRAWVFDLSGRQIMELMNHELLGTEGTVKWNGLTSNGVKVRTGAYLFYAEMVHTTGKVVRTRKIFVVK